MNLGQSYHDINSLAPGRCDYNFKCEIVKHVLMSDIWTNVGQDLKHHVALLSHNGLK